MLSCNAKRHVFSDALVPILMWWALFWMLYWLFQALRKPLGVLPLLAKISLYLHRISLITRITPSLALAFLLVLEKCLTREIFFSLYPIQHPDDQITHCSFPVSIGFGKFRLENYSPIKKLTFHLFAHRKYKRVFWNRLLYCPQQTCDENV